MRGKRQYGYGEIDYPPSIQLEKVLQEAKIKVNHFLYFTLIPDFSGINDPRFSISLENTG